MINRGIVTEPKVLKGVILVAMLLFPAALAVETFSGSCQAILS